MNLDEYARDLLGHIATRDGRVTTSNVTDDERRIAQDLIDGGLLEIVARDRRDCYRLTDTGREAAARVVREG